MQRLDRISAILIMLQSRKNVRAQDIADRYDITVRTVYRDIKSLMESGVPIIGEAGIGYTLADGYKLPPVMFTERETTALLTAEKLLEKLTDHDMYKEYLSAMTKIRAILRGTDKAYLDKVEDYITVLENPHLPKRQDQDPQMQIILKAVTEKHLLEFEYFAQHSQEHSHRQVEPIGVIFSSGKWYLIAFCKVRQDYRQFRLDRMVHLRNTRISFDIHRVSLQEYIDQMPKAQQDVHLIIVLVQKEAMRFIGDQKYYMGYISEELEGDDVKMTFLSSSIHGFARWYMMMADHMEIVTPQVLKDEIKSMFLTMSKQWL